MLDSNNWIAKPGSAQSFLIDPEGVDQRLGRQVANVAGNGSVTTVVPRISLAGITTTDQADAIFMATDDLIVTLPEDMNPVGPTGGRPTPTAALAALWPYTGAFTWFLTVTPEPGSTTRFTVSVVVCCNRNLAPTATASGERAVTVSAFYDATTVSGGTVALGGGSVQLSRPINDNATDAAAKPSTLNNIQIKENDWVALCNSQGLCRWYRVASVGDTSSTDSTQNQYLTLIGPDWASPAAGSDQLVALGQQVVGVYTTTVELDTDPSWKN